LQPSIFCLYLLFQEAAYYHYLSHFLKFWWRIHFLSSHIVFYAFEPDPDKIPRPSFDSLFQYPLSRFLIHHLNRKKGNHQLLLFPVSPPAEAYYFQLHEERDNFLISAYSQTAWKRIRCFPAFWKGLSWQILSAVYPRGLDFLLSLFHEVQAVPPAYLLYNYLAPGHNGESAFYL